MLNRIRKWCGNGSPQVIALVVLLSAPSLQALAAVNDSDLFYVPPDPLPVGQPGDIIRSRPSKAGPPTARSLGNAWQVMYRSTNSIGEGVAMTGTVLVPKGKDASSLPIVVFAPGTSGPAFKCTPSRLLNKGAFYEQSTITGMLREGYAVVIPDYEGYKPEPETTYTVESMGPAVLDVIRAAQSLEPAGLSPDAKVVLRGYSQGGGAVMRAGEMYATYAPELNIVGVAGGGVPSNLALVAIQINNTPAAGFMLYALRGQDYAYPEISLDPYLTEEGKALIDDMENNWCVVDLIQKGANYDINNIAPEALRDRLNIVNNLTLGAKPINVPVYQYHEGQDGIVPFGQASTLRNAYCNQGMDVQWTVLDTDAETPVIRHISGIYQGNIGVDQFIKDRLAGNPTSPNCDI